jgi:hypothetical protein
MTNKEKRQKITKLIDDMYNGLDSTKKNSINFHNKTDKLSDSQFIALFTSLVNDPKKHLYFEMEAFVNEPNYETIEKVANDIIGDEYCHLYDYIAFPHLSEDGKVYYTKNKIFNGYINLRRVQQLANNKNHIPTSTDKRDPRTGQVTQESKAARVSDVEQFALICQGNKKILKEMFGPRGGDSVMRDEMEYQISTSGSASLDDLTDNKLNKPSLNTTNVYFLSAGLETDLVTKNGILPRTLQNQYNKAKILDRDSVK